jgi:hypothetical protein
MISGRNAISSNNGLKLNPENPFNQMTDKDVLLFNPIYSGYLKKLNKREQEKSELGRILNDPVVVKERSKKPMVGLYIFAKS